MVVFLILESPLLIVRVLLNECQYSTPYQIDKPIHVHLK